MSEDPVQSAAAADLTSTRFLAGVVRRQWRKVSYEFPVLVMSVAAIEPDGRQSEYFFRFELSGFPGTAPEVKIWDPESNALLAVQKRPKGSGRVAKAFQDWEHKTVYRPWERFSARHNNFAQNFPDLAWHPKRDLTFILGDLHGLLTSSAAARR